MLSGNQRATRTPYQDTSVPVARSKDQISQALRAAGAKGVQYEEVWEPETRLVVRFLWQMGEQVVRVRLQARTLPPKKGVRGAWRVSPEQRERQAWRALAWYLKTMLEAATFGLLRFEDVFLSFVEDGAGRTVGEHVIPMLEAGALQLTDGSGDE